MSKIEQIEELADAIFQNCHVGLFEDEAKMIAEFCYQEIDRKTSDVAKLEQDVTNTTMELETSLSHPRGSRASFGKERKWNITN